MPATYESALDQLVQRAGALYTLPTVALEVVELLNEPHVNPREIRECIERDPALTAKVLKVVNSSLFGLSGEVANVTQAIALLGLNPLKLLVLGFSLPDELFASIAADQLQLYWSGTLNRALAARAVAERYWPRSADDALTAGLLQGVGRLVMLQQLGEPYVQFLTKLQGETGDPLELERYALGFDHCALSAALLRHWHLPEKLAGAIERQSRGGEPRAPQTDEQVLAAALRIADLIAQLVGQRRLSVLPDLLAMGEKCCGMTRPHLTGLVGKLQPQVEQFAAALTVELEVPRNYSQVLMDAHVQLTVAAEQATSSLLAAGGGGDEAECDLLLAEARDLSAAMRSYLYQRPMAAAVGPARRADVARDAVRPPRGRLKIDERPVLEVLTKLLPKCRADRASLSLVLLMLEPHDLTACEPPLVAAHAACVAKALAQQTGCAPQSMQRIDELLAVVLVAGDRYDAVQWAYNLERLSHQSSNPELPADVCEQLEVKAGVAHLAAAPKTFEVVRLWENAKRCLEAARSASGAAVKSIEVY